MVEAEKVQREERAKKTATQSHKDRVAEYNAKLERLRYVTSVLRASSS